MGLGVIAVGLPAAALAYRIQQHSVQPGDDDAVVSGIGDEQAVAGLVGQDFARET